MAKELQIAIGRTGLTGITATTYLAGVVSTSGIVCTELVGQGGLYQGDMTGAAGLYSVQYFNNGVPLASIDGIINWSGTAEISGGGSSPTSIATAVWQDLLSGSDFSTVGSSGKLLKDNLDALISSRSANTDVQTLLTRLSATRATYLDNLNTSGVVASQADILAINTSSSKHLLLQTVGYYEIPDQFTNNYYTIECRTFNAVTGAAVNADSSPTLTGTGYNTGSLAGRISAITNPATGVYRWTYTASYNDASEQIRFDVSATIASATFTLTCYSQSLDDISLGYTAGDAAKLTAIYNKLPTNNIADETNATTNKNAILTAISGIGGGTLTAVQIRTEMDDHSTKLASILSNITQIYGVYTGANLPDPAAFALICGDDYYSADGRARTFSISGTNPSWVGASLRLDLTINGVTSTITALSFDTTGTPRNVSFEIAGTITKALGVGIGRYDIVAILANTHRVTAIQSGPLEISY
jgi:hypothetical protein